jgi:hypothetical protein
MQRFFVNPNNATEIINVGLSLENTLLTLLRLQLPGLTSPPQRAKLMEPPPLVRCADWFMLAYGFETFAVRQTTFAWWQKAKLSRLLTVFKEQPDTDKCIYWVNSQTILLSGWGTSCACW